MFFFIVVMPTSKAGHLFDKWFKEKHIILRLYFAIYTVAVLEVKLQIFFPINLHLYI